MRKTLAALTVVSILMTVPIWISAARDEELKPVPETVKVGFDSITEEDAVNYVDFLACDELEGRDTGTRGMRIARRYVASLFKHWGLKPAGDLKGNKRSYHQLIKMMEVMPGNKACLEVTVGGTTTAFEKGVDIFLGRGGSSTIDLEAEVVFAGYGISAPDLGYDDLEGLDLEGKIVLILDGVPGQGKEDSPFTNPENSRRFSRYYRYRTISETLRKSGASAVLTVRDSNRRTVGLGGTEYRQGDSISSPGRRVIVPSLASSNTMMSFNVTARVADSILASAGTNMAELKKKIDTDLKSASMAVEGVQATIHTEAKLEPFIGGNVLGMVEGSDPELKNEFIIIGAHLDHLGMNDQGYVFNGADDNASGSAGVMEAAQAFALNPKKPKRSILFACWTGEEKGLYGSRYFAEFPSIDGMKMITCLNMDMISRDWSLEQLERISKRWGANLTGGVEINKDNISRIVTASMSAQSPALEEISSRLNKEHVGLLFIPRPSARLSGGSDHAPFHQKDIPAVFFFAAMTDDYHQPGDTVDKLNGKKMRDIIRLLYLTAFEIADADETITWTKPEPEK